MRNVFTLLTLILGSTICHAQVACSASPLSNEQVKQIIDRERAARTDLPAPYEDYRWEARRDGCHYVYLEFAIPEVPDRSRVFRLNQHGMIVDVAAGIRGGLMQCPEKVFSEQELAAIVAAEREKRSELPALFAEYETRVGRTRCLYDYFEYNLPKRRGDYQVFTIDPFGELLSFSRSEPY